MYICDIQKARHHEIIAEKNQKDCIVFVIINNITPRLKIMIKTGVRDESQRKDKNTKEDK